MKNYFLASYSNLVIDKILEILPDDPHKLKLAFIPTARDPYNIIAKTDPEKDKLVSMGFLIKEVDLKNKSKEQLSKELSDIDVVFVAGGNTFYLLEKVIESGFDILIKELVAKGVIYIGVSAGAVLVGPDIKIVEDLDDPKIAPNLKTTSGIGLVDFIVLPHFGEGPLKGKTDEIYRKWKQLPNKIIPLTNEQAIIVSDNAYKIVSS